MKKYRLWAKTWVYLTTNTVNSSSVYRSATLVCRGLWYLHQSKQEEEKLLERRRDHQALVMLGTSTGLVTGNHGDDDHDKGTSRMTASWTIRFLSLSSPAAGPHSRRGLSMANGTLSAFTYCFLNMVCSCITPCRCAGPPLSP